MLKTLQGFSARFLDLINSTVGRKARNPFVADPIANENPGNTPEQFSLNSGARGRRFPTLQSRHFHLVITSAYQTCRFHFSGKRVNRASPTMSALSNPTLCNLRALELMPRESPNYTVTSSMARYESLTCPDCRLKIHNRPSSLRSLFRLTLLPLLGFSCGEYRAW